MKTSINQQVINQLAQTLNNLESELDRLRDVASNEIFAIDRASAGLSVEKLSGQIALIAASLDVLNF